MPVVACPACHRAVTLPDPWTAAGFTCPFCHKASPVPPPQPPAPRPAPAPAPAAEILELDDDPLPPPRPARAPIHREDEDEDEPIPARDRVRPAGPSTGLIAGIGLLVLAGGVVAVLAATGAFSGKKKVEVAEQRETRPEEKPREVPPTPKADRPEPASDNKTERPTVKPEPDRPEPKPEAKPAPKPTEPEPPATKPAAKPEPPAKTAPEPVTAELDVAPPPRPAAGHRVPPGKWVSAWQPNGDVRVRVLNVSVRRVRLFDPKGKPYDSQPVLAVWVEVENTGKSPRELRSWFTPLAEYAKLHNQRELPVGRAQFGPGVRVEEMPAATRPLPPGETLAALLLFSAPDESNTELELYLDAQRVGEKYGYRFKIPAKAWR